MTILPLLFFAIAHIALLVLLINLSKFAEAKKHAINVKDRKRLIEIIRKDIKNDKLAELYLCDNPTFIMKLKALFNPPKF